MDARGRSKRGGYRRENRNDEMQDFLPEFFVHVHELWVLNDELSIYLKAYFEEVFYQ